MMTVRFKNKMYDVDERDCMYLRTYEKRHSSYEIKCLDGRVWKINTEIESFPSNIVIFEVEPGMVVEVNIPFFKEII